MRRRRDLPTPSGRPIRLLVIAVVVTLVGAGCGGGDEEGEPAPATIDPTTGATVIPGTSAEPPSTAGASTPSAPAGPLPAVRLTRLAEVSQPTAMSFRRGDPNLYVTEQPGRVKAVADGRTSVVGDITDRVLAGGERGLLGIAFSTDGSTVYLYWTARQPTGRVTIAAYPFGDGRIDVSGERVLVTIPHEQYGNHNGGQLGIGPDGFLYAGVGDGGGSGNPLETALDTNSLLGKVLRIDPTRPSGGRPYGIPPGNPFADGRGGAPEVWAYGLRNPWRFSWDRGDGRLFIADVGQNAYEEVNAVAGDRAGVNYGWDRREGLHPYKGGSRPPGAVDPVIELPHSEGVCSVTGGHVYRGGRIPGLVGRYVFTDYCDSRLRAARQDGDGWVVERLEANGRSVTSFGQDEAGELYVLDSAGLSRLDPA